MLKLIKHAIPEQLASSIRIKSAIKTSKDRKDTSKHTQDAHAQMLRIFLVSPNCLKFENISCLYFYFQSW